MAGSESNRGSAVVFDEHGVCGSGRGSPLTNIFVFVGYKNRTVSEIIKSFLYASRVIILGFFLSHQNH